MPSKKELKLVELAERQEEAARRLLPADRRRAAGKALRDSVSRSAHAGWQAPDDRPDPVDTLLESNRWRLPALVPVRFGRMLASPFAFFRGSAAIMAGDLAATAASGLQVQACGDAHLLNFGAFATPERNVVFDINDLDETLPAPWEWDLKRLAASIVIAGQHLRLPESDCAAATAEAAREYRKRMADYAAMRALDVWYDRIDIDRLIARAAELEAADEGELREAFEERLDEARRKSATEHLYPKLVREDDGEPRIKDDPPLIYHPTAEEAPGMASGYEAALAHYRQSLAEHTRVLFDRFELRDLAIKVVGVGSVGTRCALALFTAADDDPLFLQIKEARASVLEPYAGKSRHANHGERVVAGQRLMQAASDIFLGWTKGLGGQHYYIRQLRDVKLSAVIEGWSAKLLTAYGRLCAWALARAHARSGDAAAIAGYAGSGSSFDDAICEFAVEYADQNKSDYRAFVEAVREHRIEAVTGL